MKKRRYFTLRGKKPFALKDIRPSLAIKIMQGISEEFTKLA
jgi:hypothetical protein